MEKIAADEKQFVRTDQIEMIASQSQSFGVLSGSVMIVQTA